MTFNEVVADVDKPSPHPNPEGVLSSLAAKTVNTNTFYLKSGVVAAAVVR